MSNKVGPVPVRTAGVAGATPTDSSSDGGDLPPTRDARPGAGPSAAGPAVEAVELDMFPTSRAAAGSEELNDASPRRSAAGRGAGGGTRHKARQRLVERLSRAPQATHTVLAEGGAAAEPGELKASEPGELKLAASVLETSLDPEAQHAATERGNSFGNSFCNSFGSIGSGLNAGSPRESGHAALAVSPQRLGHAPPRRSVPFTADDVRAYADTAPPVASHSRESFSLVPQSVDVPSSPLSMPARRKGKQAATSPRVLPKLRGSMVDPGAGQPSSSSSLQFDPKPVTSKDAEGSTSRLQPASGFTGARQTLPSPPVPERATRPPDASPAPRKDGGDAAPAPKRGFALWRSRSRKAKGNTPNKRPSTAKRETANADAQRRKTHGLFGPRRSKVSTSHTSQLRIDRPLTAGRMPIQTGPSGDGDTTDLESGRQSEDLDLGLTDTEDQALVVQIPEGTGHRGASPLEGRRRISSVTSVLSRILMRSSADLGDCRRGDSRQIMMVAERGQKDTLSEHPDQRRLASRRGCKAGGPAQPRKSDNSMHEFPGASAPDVDGNAGVDVGVDADADASTPGSSAGGSIAAWNARVRAHSTSSLASVEASSAAVGSLLADALEELEDRTNLMHPEGCQPHIAVAYCYVQDALNGRLNNGMGAMYVWPRSTQPPPHSPRHLRVPHSPVARCSLRSWEQRKPWHVAARLY